MYACRNCDCKADNCCRGGGYCSAPKAVDAPAGVVANDADPIGDGTCCPEHRQGKACDQCVSGFYGVNCSACPGFVDRTDQGLPSIVCLGHGTCDAGIYGNGTCACQQGYYGDDCGLCDSTFCEASCSGHGQCVHPLNEERAEARLLHKTKMALIASGVKARNVRAILKKIRDEYDEIHHQSSTVL